MPEKPRLLVVGAGGHGRSVAEAAVLGRQYNVVGFLDDGLDAGSRIIGLPVLGRTDSSLDSFSITAVVVAVGNNKLRQTLMDRYRAEGKALVPVVHPTAIVSPSASIGEGAVVMAGVVVGSLARLGAGVIVNSGCVVDHDCVLEDFSHLGVGVSLAGGVLVGSGAWLQAGCSVGARAVVPAGATMTPGVQLKL